MTSYSNYAAYLLKVLGRNPDLTELTAFVNNQDLLKIIARSSQNDAYHIAFVNGTAVPLLTNGMLLGAQFSCIAGMEDTGFIRFCWRKQEARRSST